MSPSNTHHPNPDRLIEIQQSRQWLLYRIAWQGEQLDLSHVRKHILDHLVVEKLVEPKGNGYVATDVGRSVLSSLAKKALERPLNYNTLRPAEQWAIDDRLGLLDWDGT